MSEGLQAMKKLGVIGGMSWVSTAVYYDRINRIVQRRAKFEANAPMVIDSLDFAEFRNWRDTRDWDLARRLLIESAKRLEDFGADGLLIGANTMHKLYDAVAAEVGIPILNIVDAVGKEVASSKHRKVALVGTRTVMQDEGFRKKFTDHGLELMPIDPQEIDMVERIIYDELMVGRATRDAERKLRTLFFEAAQDGAEAAILACTELEAVVDTDANVLPVFDSTDIHCRVAADFILEGVV